MDDHTMTSEEGRSYFYIRLNVCTFAGSNSSFDDNFLYVCDCYGISKCIFKSSIHFSISAHSKATSCVLEKNLPIALVGLAQSR
jgi:hypothetical protein